MRWQLGHWRRPALGTQVTGITWTPAEGGYGEGRESRPNLYVNTVTSQTIAPSDPGPERCPKSGYSSERYHLSALGDFQVTLRAKEFSARCGTRASRSLRPCEESAQQYVQIQRRSNSRSSWVRSRPGVGSGDRALRHRRSRSPVSRAVSPASWLRRLDRCDSSLAPARIS